MKLLTKAAKASLYALAFFFAGAWAFATGLLALVAAITIVGIPAAAALVAIGGAPMAYLLNRVELLK